MKTYLLDTFNRFKRYSEKLDAQTVLCNKCWWVFNDAGEKETYIFKEDGIIIISLSGVVTYGKWEYLPVNKSVIISGNNQSFMVIPSFLDECILALQVDGTNNFAFLIDEQNKLAFAPMTYQDVIGYFEEKERKAIAANEEAERKVIEARKEAERKELAAKKEAERKALEEEKRKKKEEIEQIAIDINENFSVYFVSIWGFITIVSLGTISTFIDNYVLENYILLINPNGIFVTAFVIFIIIGLIVFLKSRKWYLKRYIRKHPNNPEIPYLEKLL